MDILSRRAWLLAIVTAGTWLQGAAAHAAVINWNTNSSGNFNDAGNWTSNTPGTGVPGSQDEASFARGSARAYTVTFPGDFTSNPTRTYTNSQLYVGNNTVTFGESTSRLLGRANYTLTNPTTAVSPNRGIVVGEASTDTAATLITGLNTLTAVAATLGDQGVGTLKVIGGTVNITDTSTPTTESTGLIVGNDGVGKLFVSDGGKVNVTGASGGMYVGYDGGNPSSVSIDGAGAQVNVQGAGSVLGVYEGAVAVTNGGLLATNGDTVLSGSVSVDGVGSSWNANNIRFESGTISITAGGSVTAAGAQELGYITVDGTGSTLSIANNTVEYVTVTNGGQVIDTYDNHQRADISVSGAGSKWTSGAGGFSISFFEKFSVLSGGQLVTQSTYLGSDSGNHSNTAKVDGSGSTWTSQDMYVGDGEEATLQVINGGNVSVLNATLGVNAPGTNDTDDEGGIGAIVVDGANSKFTATSGIKIGQFGKGTLTVSAGGVVSDADGYIGTDVMSIGSASVGGSGSKWTNSGSLHVGQAGTGSLNVINGGNVTSATGFVGDAAGGSGSVTIDGANSKWTLTGDLRVGDAGTATLTVKNGGSVSTTANVIIGAHGTLGGDSTVTAAMVQNGGMVSPGNSPGVLHVQGNYSQTADGKLEVELNGTTLGTAYDQLAVSGNMALNGALDITFGYTPHAGDSFDILDWGTRSGAFGVFNFPTLTGLRFDVSQLYTTGVLTILTKLPAGVLPGDFDQDGHVTQTDYGFWKAGFGISGVATHLQGDANGDGRVDAADYTIWRDELGQTGATGGSGAEATTAVPEPGTLLLTVIAMISMAFGVRGRRCTDGFIAGL
ncbi:MAG TPA: PEP-CTERM sorting domain-containing protein [Lacipirellulaceae bacterium]|jgi:T5SS/PEP-CTERM-associated repeat protein